jgi:hypothetical protein
MALARATAWNNWVDASGSGSAGLVPAMLAEQTAEAWATATYVNSWAMAHGSDDLRGVSQWCWKRSFLRHCYFGA